MINFVDQNELENKEEKECINGAFNKLKITDEFSIIFSTSDYIKELNTTYREKDYVTDVLTFPSDEEDYLGDVFICLDKARQQSIEYNHTYSREIVFLAIHGYLHLLGYDHIEKNDEEVMLKKQHELLEIAGYRRN